jgi:hypothetical protein
MPPASATLRLLAFAVPASLAVSAVQPLLALAIGAARPSRALSLSLPALAVAAAILLAALATDRGAQPPWFAAWALLPGAFLLAGAASMCLFGALVELPTAARAGWVLLASGGVLWSAGLLLVRLRSL